MLIFLKRWEWRGWGGASRFDDVFKLTLFLQIQAMNRCISLFKMFARMAPTETNEQQREANIEYKKWRSKNKRWWWGGKENENHGGGEKKGKDFCWRVRCEYMNGEKELCCFFSFMESKEYPERLRRKERYWKRRKSPKESELDKKKKKKKKKSIAKVTK